MNNISDTIGYLLGLLLGAFVLDLIFSLPIMYLWNWLMPKIFGLPTLTWLETFGLTLLINMLFSKGNSNEKS